MLQRMDDAIARVEKLLLLVSLTMMTALVGTDVVQRTFSRPVGRTESLIAGLINAIAGPLDADARTTALRFGSVVFVVVAAAMFVFATHTARGVVAERSGGAMPVPTLGKSIALGLGLLVLSGIFVRVVLFAFPSSVPGAQKFALGFMLWAGMLGASLATKQRRHIVLDPILKKLEGKDRHSFGLISALVSASFCAFITTIGVLQLAGEVHDWSTGTGVGLYPALPIPLWLGTLAIPVTFAVMTLRFLKNGLQDLREGPPNVADAHGVDLEEVKKLADAKGDSSSSAGSDPTPTPAPAPTPSPAAVVQETP